MYPGARVIGRRSHIGCLPSGIRAHDDVSALLLRTSFHPIDVSAIEARLREGYGLRDDEVRCDRRFPGAVRRRLGREGRHISVVFQPPPKACELRGTRDS